MKATLLLQLSLVLLSVADFPVLLSLPSSVLEVDSQQRVRTQARDFPLAPFEKKKQTVGNLGKKLGGPTWGWREERMENT